MFQEPLVHNRYRAHWFNVTILCYCGDSMKAVISMVLRVGVSMLALPCGLADARQIGRDSDPFPNMFCTMQDCPAHVAPAVAVSTLRRVAD